jgi:hypothetical protein
MATVKERFEDGLISRLGELAQAIYPTEDAVEYGGANRHGCLAAQVGSVANAIVRFGDIIEQGIMYLVKHQQSSDPSEAIEHLAWVLKGALSSVNQNDGNAEIARAAKHYGIPLREDGSLTPGRYAGGKPVGENECLPEAGVSVDEDGTLSERVNGGTNELDWRGQWTRSEDSRD